MHFGSVIKEPGSKKLKAIEKISKVYENARRLKSMFNMVDPITEKEVKDSQGKSL